MNFGHPIPTWPDSRALSKQSPCCALMNFFGKSEFGFEDPRGNDRLPGAVSEHENETGTLCRLDSPSNGRFLATSGREMVGRGIGGRHAHCCGRCGRGWQSSATRTKSAGRNQGLGLAAEDVPTYCTSLRFGRRHI
jgi:hypothetical protein